MITSAEIIQNAITVIYTRETMFSCLALKYTLISNRIQQCEIAENLTSFYQEFLIVEYPELFKRDLTSEGLDYTRLYFDEYQDLRQANKRIEFFENFLKVLTA